MKQMIATLILAAASSANAAPGAGEADAMTRMFTWWNQAFTQPQGFTAEAFSKYFTADAELIIDGKLSAQGIDHLVEHFRRIQVSGLQVHIEVPFKQGFSQGELISTYHVINLRKEGKPLCQLAAGYGVVREGKLAEVNLVRSVTDHSVEPLCWE